MIGSVTAEKCELTGPLRRVPAKNLEMPFCVGKSAGIPLAYQIADGIRSAIESGYYQPGQILPTRKEFARALGVSERAPREAVALLASEGLVYTRRCLGCVVANPVERRWLGRVLLVTGSYAQSYYHTAFFEAFSHRMEKAGYMVMRISCSLQGCQNANLSPLQDALRQPFDFIISLENDRRIVSEIRNSGVRSLVFSRRNLVGASDETAISIDADEAIDELIGRCECRGVRSILQVGFAGANPFFDLCGYAFGFGTRIISWNLPLDHHRTGVEQITYGAMRAFARRLAADRKWLPDLLFFRDDFVAVGCLTALLQSGVRVPEDVRVVTVSNRGNCPVFPKSLARIELDPEQNGIVYAERILKALAPTRFRRSGSVAYRYRSGATFP